MSQLWMEGFDKYGGDIDKMLNGVWAAFNGAAYSLSDTYARTGQYSMRVVPSGLTPL